MQLRPVINRLAALSKRLLLRILAVGGSKALVALCGLILLSFFLDWGLHLPKAVRAIHLALSLGVLGYVIYRHLLRPLARKPSIDELALIAERADPGLNDQLISAIQLERDLAAGRAVESPELIQALIDDTVERLRNRSFQESLSLKPAARPVGLALAGIVLTGGLALAFPEHARLWAERQLLLSSKPWPQRNTLEISIPDIERFAPVQDGDRWILHVPERTPLQVTVTAAPGKSLPDEVSLVAANLDEPDQVQPISMGRAPGKEYFQHIFPPLLRSIVFHAEGGDDDDGVPVYEIRVARAPRAVRFFAEYDYPEYTGLDDRSLSDGNLSAPEGTRITMNFEVNMDLEEFRIDFEKLGARVPARVDERRWTFSFDVEENDFYTYELRGENGVTSTDVPRFVVTAEVDQPPRVNVEMPASTSVFVTPEATLPLKGMASDDYGVTEIGLRFGTTEGSLDAGAVTFAEEDLLQPGGSRQIPFFHTLEIRDLSLPGLPSTSETAPAGPRAIAEGDRFTFKFLVTDDRRTASQPEPHRAFGDYEFHVQVLSSRDLQRELAHRQVRLRDRVQDIANLVEARINDTTGLLQAVRAAADQEQLRTRFWGLEQDQNRITIELQASARQFLRVYDGYLWNRLDPGFLTEKMISLLAGLHRTARDAEAFQIYGQAVSEVRPQIDEAEIMGRLTVILDLLLRTAAERSPEAHRRLARAGLVTSPEERIEQLEGALAIQRLLLEDVLRLVERLEAWEDYLDVIQGFRDLLELQKGVQQRIEKVTNK